MIVAQDCLRVCGNEKPKLNEPTLNYGIWYLGDDTTTLLNQCLDDERGGQRSIRLPPTIYGPDKLGVDGNPIDYSVLNETVRVSNMTDLAKCCGSTEQCTTSLEVTQQCMEAACLAPCLQTTTRDYFQCITTQATQDSCDANMCLDGFFPASSNPSRLGPSLDLDLINNAYQGVLNQTSLQDCNRLHPFVNQACRISNQCCQDCDSYLANTLNCIINDLVLPYALLELNITTTVTRDVVVVDQCLIGRDDDDRTNDPTVQRACELAPSTGRPTKRDLIFEEEVDDNEYLHRLLHESDVEHDHEEEVDIDLLERDCQNRLVKDMIATNITYAAGRYTGCLGEKVLEVVFNESSDLSGSGDVQAGGETTEGSSDGMSSSFGVWNVGSFVAMMMTGAVVLFTM